MRIGLRIDVDTFRGTRYGVPALCRLLADHAVNASFFFSVGPDNMGRHLLRLIRPHFFLKMLRTKASSLYGWDILFRGTLWPGPIIGRKLGHIIRSVSDAGHEVGLHAWDHHGWQANIERMKSDAIFHSLDRGVALLTGILDRQPTCSAVPAWKCNDLVLLEKVKFPFSYNSDCKGVWFITGNETAGLYNVFEAMGYAVATDRLWQAELYRRTARGRLAEIFGPSQLGSDIFIRTTAYSDQELQDGFAALDSEVQSVINGYVAGFNRRIAEVNADVSLVPYEFKAIGLTQVADWEYQDVLAWMAFLQRDFDPEASNDFQIDNMTLYGALAAAFPASFQGMFDDLRWINDPDALTYIPLVVGAPASPAEAEDVYISKQTADEIPDFSEAVKNITGIRKDIVENLKKINAYVKMGSYAWTVAGSKTASGNPMIYSGPQMGFPVPSVVLEGSLRGAGLNISGMSVPGIPGIIIGRTPHHAWSMQVANAHTVDYYIESPDDVVWNRDEIIKVAGSDDFELKVYRTSHGPVINPMPYDPGK